jgi:hypothetical protein
LHEQVSPGKQEIAVAMRYESQAVGVEDADDGAARRVGGDDRIAQGDRECHKKLSSG